MAATEQDDVEAPAEPDHCVSALQTTPDRVVFTEEGNCDGWISTDYTVEPER